MSDTLHWLRPWWLLALIPVLLLLWLAWRRQTAAHSAWRAFVDPHLMRHLLVARPGVRRRWPLLALACAWLLTVVALAGPVWQRITLPSFAEREPTVLVLNMSPAMNASDDKPDRLSRARYKMQDILEQLKGAQVALVIYADRPFVASPLTDDVKVIAHMLPELSGDLMPPLGDRADRAISQAADLLAGIGAPYGRILLLSNGLGDQPQEALRAAAAAHARGYRVSVIGVGSASGASVRDRHGNLRHSVRDEAALQSLAQRGGGVYAPLAAGDEDWRQVLTGGSDQWQVRENGEEGLKADQWQEYGHWLLLPPLLVALLAFRRGWLASLLVMVTAAGLVATPAPVVAAERQSWWLTPDQQGQEAFKQGDYAAASDHFADPAWAAAARYKAGDYQRAAKDFQALGTPQAMYNAGNALARAGDYQNAIAAYDAALEAEPDNADARYNRELVQKLLEQREQQNPQDGQNPQPADTKDAGQQQLQQQMDRALAEQQPAALNETGQDGAAQAGEAVTEPPLTPEEQTREQLLRRVPDDPTGLLRARIYQHYRSRRD